MKTTPKQFPPTCDAFGKRVPGRWLPWLKVTLLAALALWNVGCANMFTSGHVTTKTPWTTFADAKGAYDRVEPGKTTLAELQGLGFDPFVSQNLKVLTYLDVLNRFVPNNSVRIQDLPAPVQAFLAAQDKSLAYELDATVTRSQRYGNLFLDIFAFNRKTHETGWNFKALFLINDGRVIYKLWAGQPVIDRYEQKKKPLGPLQEVDLNIPVPVVR